MTADDSWNQAGRIARLEIARAQRQSVLSAPSSVPRITLSRPEMERLIERLQRHIAESRR